MNQSEPVEVVDSSQFRQEIDGLLQAKRQGEELDRGLRIEPISSFIESELERLEKKKFQHEYGRAVIPVDELDRLFRAALEEVWSL